jgi:hypothetical protein
MSGWWRRDCARKRACLPDFGWHPLDASHESC